MSPQICSHQCNQARGALRWVRSLIFTAGHHKILGLHGRLIGRLLYGDKSMRECGGRDLDLDYIPDLQIIYDERLPERRVLPMVSPTDLRGAHDHMCVGRKAGSASLITSPSTKQRMRNPRRPCAFPAPSCLNYCRLHTACRGGGCDPREPTPPSHHQPLRDAY
jgi:hypothetical protein